MLRGDGWARTNLHELTRQLEADEPAVVQAAAYPQDDVWLGMALATSVSLPLPPRTHLPSSSQPTPARAANTQQPDERDADNDTDERDAPVSLHSLHAGSVVYAEGVYDRAYPLYSTTLIWHSGHPLNKMLSRQTIANSTRALADLIRSMHRRFEGSNRCDTPNVTLNCGSSDSAFRSCANATWERCLVVHNYGACSKEALRPRSVPSAALRSQRRT